VEIPNRRCAGRVGVFECCATSFTLWAMRSAIRRWVCSCANPDTGCKGTEKRRRGRHPDRNAQFEFIYQEIRRQQSRGQPVISVDTKKKELVGDFKNAGREWRPRGKPHRVRVHDFLLPAKGKAIPYGVYDLTITGIRTHEELRVGLLFLLRLMGN
jgi:hypothetical protein